MENIRMGKKMPPMMLTCKASGCHDLIQSLPHGYQTVVGGSGGHLSVAENASV